MIRKIIAGTLIIVVLSTPGAMVYANPIDSLNTIEQTEVEIHKKEIELNSPKISPEGEVFETKKLLISGQIFIDTPVYLGVYMVLEDKNEVILEPEIIEVSGENYKTFSKILTDLKPGNYKMEFTKEGQEEPFETISFKLKEPTLPNLLEKKFSDLILGQ